MQRLRLSIEVIAGLFFGLVAIITLAAAVSRVTFSLGLPDANEIARLAQGIAVLWGIALASYDGRHVTVDILYERLSAGRRKAIDLIATLIVTICLGVVSYMTLIRGIEAFNRGLTTNELRILIGPFWLVAGVGLVAAALLAGIRFISILQGRLK